MVDEELRPKCGGQFLQQTVCHRRACETELANRGNIGFSEVLMIDEIVIKGWDEVKIGHELAFDQFKGPYRLKARQTDESARDERHREERAHAHSVVKRHDAEWALPKPVEILRDMGDRGRPFDVVAPRHPFWSRCRTARVEHQ